MESSDTTSQHTLYESMQAFYQSEELLLKALESHITEQSGHYKERYMGIQKKAIDSFQDVVGSIYDYYSEGSERDLAIAGLLKASDTIVVDHLSELVPEATYRKIDIDDTQDDKYVKRISDLIQGKSKKATVDSVTCIYKGQVNMNSRFAYGKYEKPIKKICAQMVKYEEPPRKQKKQLGFLSGVALGAMIFVGLDRIRRR